MNEVLFSLMFAVLGMTGIFIVIFVITACLLVMGWIMRKGHAPTTPRKRWEPLASSPTGPPAEHLVAIATAVAIHRGGSASRIPMLLDGDLARSRVGSAFPPQRPDRIQALRRTR